MLEVDPGGVMPGMWLLALAGHMWAGGQPKPPYGCGGYRPYPAARANSVAARSAARFLKIRLIDETEGAVAFVHTPDEQEGAHPIEL